MIHRLRLMPTVKHSSLADIFANPGLSLNAVSQASGVHSQTVSKAVKGKCIRRDLMVSVLDAINELKPEKLGLLLDIADAVDCT